MRIFLIIFFLISSIKSFSQDLLLENLNLGDTLFINDVYIEQWDIEIDSFNYEILIEKESESFKVSYYDSSVLLNKPQIILLKNYLLGITDSTIYDKEYVGKDSFSHLIHVNNKLIKKKIGNKEPYYSCSDFLVDIGLMFEDRLMTEDDICELEYAKIKMRIDSLVSVSDKVKLYKIKPVDYGNGDYYNQTVINRKEGNIDTTRLVLFNEVLPNNLELIKTLTENACETGIYDECYEPGLGILFEKEGKVRQFIEICLLCDAFRYFPKQNVLPGTITKKQSGDLKLLFKIKN